MNRPPITTEICESILSAFREKLKRSFEKHGPGACISTHEAIGMLEEEKSEILTATHENNIAEFFDESIDIMIVGFWAAASVKAGGITDKWEH